MLATACIGDKIPSTNQAGHVVSWSYCVDMRRRRSHRHRRCRRRLILSVTARPPHSWGRRSEWNPPSTLHIRTDGITVHIVRVLMNYGWASVSGSQTACRVRPLRFSSNWAASWITNKKRVLKMCSSLKTCAESLVVKKNNTLKTTDFWARILRTCSRSYILLPAAYTTDVFSEILPAAPAIHALLLLKNVSLTSLPIG